MKIKKDIIVGKEIIVWEGQPAWLKIPSIIEGKLEISQQYFQKQILKKCSIFTIIYKAIENIPFIFFHAT